GETDTLTQLIGSSDSLLPPIVEDSVARVRQSRVWASFGIQQREMMRSWLSELAPNPVPITGGLDRGNIGGAGAKGGLGKEPSCGIWVGMIVEPCGRNGRRNE